MGWYAQEDHRQGTGRPNLESDSEAALEPCVVAGKGDVTMPVYHPEGLLITFPEDDVSVAGNWFCE